MAATPPTPAVRLPGVERLRAAATAAVVLLHAAIAYMPHPLPKLAWATHDDVTPWADAVGWIANSFVMPVFFVLGGFSLAGLLGKLGPRETAKHRLRRLGGPLLLGCVLILPLDLYAWLLGYAADGLIPLKKLKSLKIGPAGEGLWGPSHLWFLQYLLVYCLAAAGLRRTGWRTPPRLRTFLTSPAGVLALAVVTSVPLAIEPAIQIGFSHSWLPLPLNLAFYAPMFAFGTLLAAPAESLRVADHRRSGTAAFGLGHAAAGLISLACSWPLVSQHVDSLFEDAAPLAAESRWAMAFLFTTSGWLIAAGLFGAATRDRRPLSRPVATFAAASFWIYLLHHPVVGCAQVALKPLQWPAELKFAIVSLYGFGIPLLTFDLCVRRTAIGRVLGIKRPTPAISDQTVRRAA